MVNNLFFRWPKPVFFHGLKRWLMVCSSFHHFFALPLRRLEAFTAETAQKPRGAFNKNGAAWMEVEVPC